VTIVRGKERRETSRFSQGSGKKGERKCFRFLILQHKEPSNKRRMRRERYCAWPRGGNKTRATLRLSGSGVRTAKLKRSVDGDETARQQEERGPVSHGTENRFNQGVKKRCAPYFSLRFGWREKKMTIPLLEGVRTEDGMLGEGKKENRKVR